MHAMAVVDVAAAGLAYSCGINNDAAPSATEGHVHCTHTLYTY